MTFQEPLFLLDIRVELSNAFATHEYEITANSENLFEAFLLNITKNKKKGHTKDKKTTIQMKKEISIRCTRGFKEYGKSVLLAKSATELISIMKIHNIQLDIKSKANADGGIGTVFIPWTKSFIQYLKNIVGHPKLPPVVQKEKFNVVNDKKNISVGSLTITIKLISLASNFYKFISSSKANVRIYRNLFSNPKLLEQQSNIVLSGDHKHARENIYVTKYTCNNGSDITYNIIDSTENNSSRRIVKTHNIENNKDETNISDTDPCIDKTCKSVYELDSLKGKGRKQANKCPNKFTNTTYCVNYFTSNKNESPMKTITFKKDGNTPPKALPVANFKSSHSTYSKPDLPVVEVTSCHDITCDANIRRSKLPIYDGSLALDLTNINNQCCEAQGSASLKFDQHPCYCTCECKFEFIRETTYCEICGGYEVIGEEFADTRGQEMPMPCPIFHKLAGKYKLRNRSSSGSIRRRKGDGSSRSTKSSRSTRSSSSKTSEKRPNVPEKKVVQPKLKKTLQTKKLIKLEKMDYSYKTPHIGHGDCVHPCTRSAILKCNVPKSMGWFWTADDVDGLEYRPTWRPGAAENHLVELLAAARHHKHIIMKKRKKEVSKFKRPLKRPLLVVHKRDGEFTITMETMKASAKPREIFEQPYEDKPLLTYTIGRTDEENKEREKQKLKKQRRLEREQREYVQGAFKNVCQEICLKTCQQALGILPEQEDKQGLCYANERWVEPENSNPSCACSDNSLSVSDTDSDEWLIEFTPPNAFFDPSRKGRKIVKIERDTQYISPEC